MKNGLLSRGSWVRDGDGGTTSQGVDLRLDAVEPPKAAETGTGCTASVSKREIETVPPPSSPATNSGKKPYVICEHPEFIT